MSDSHHYFLAHAREAILKALPATFSERSAAPLNVAAPPVPLPYAMPSPGPAPAPSLPVARSIDRGKVNGTGSVIELDGLVVRVASTDPGEVQPMIDALRQARFTILRVQQVRPSLEDLFLDTVTDSVTGRAAGAGASLLKPARNRP